MAVEQNPRAQVLDLSRPGAVTVEIEVAEAAEVLMSICALADRGDHDTFDLGAEWLQAQLESVPAGPRDEVDALRLGDMKVAAHLLGIVYETPQPADVRRLHGAARGDRSGRAEAAPLRPLRHVVGHIPPDIVESAARGDEAAIDKVLEALAEWSDKHELYRGLLQMDGLEVKSRIVDLLPRWYEHVFAPHEQEWRAAAERDAESKRALAKRHSPEQLVELAARGYQYSPPAAIRRLVFFPSWFMRPWVILWEHKSTKIFCYPIAPAPEEGASPAEVARVYKALGDEGRLKLLRRLSDGPMKLSEAAAELGVAKSTAHHHLAILRQAGFVTIRDEDENVYSLRTRPAADRRPADRLPRRLEVLGDERVEDAVDPAVAAAVRLPLDALADEARALRVPLRPLVEAVDLELDPVEAELVDQVALEAAGRPRRRGGGRGSRDGRRGRRRATIRLRRLRQLPAPSRRRARRRARRSIDAAAPPDPARSSATTPVAVVGPGGGEERAHVLVGVELDEEVDVGVGRPAGSRRSRPDGGGLAPPAGARRLRRARRRRGSARARRASAAVIASSRSTAP